MNLNLTKDEFHETVMLYLIQITRENKSILMENETIVFTPEFDDFLRHIAKRPLGDLRTVYYREPAKVKLSYKRMYKLLQDKDQVRLII